MTNEYKTVAVSRETHERLRQAGFVANMPIGRLVDAAVNYFLASFDEDEIAETTERWLPQPEQEE